MYIIFGSIANWQVFLLKVLTYLKFKVFYLYIEAKSDVARNEIAMKLKLNNIFPLPIEFEEKISPKAFSLLTGDTDEVAYKKNLKLIPDKILKKYCHLFYVHETKIKKLRLLIQDFVAGQQMLISGKLGVWSAAYPLKKIIYISFKFKCFYLSETGTNIYKIIIPIDILTYFSKFIKKTILFFLEFVDKKNNQNLHKNKIKELLTKKVALITHQGITVGSKEKGLLFEKSLYYSDDANSCLSKNNILHLDYSNFSSPEQNIYWVCLKKEKINSTKIFFKTFLACFKTFYLIKNWQTFLGWLLCMKQYNAFIKYNEAIKKFINLRIALIDHDYLCPKTLILALEKNNIKTVATQDRFITTFYTSYVNVILDTYYTASEYTAKFIKKSKYCDVTNIIPIGQYRSDYIPLYKKEIPKAISNAKKTGKKILIVLGPHARNYWFESYCELQVNWSAQINFLEDIIKLSQHLSNAFIILRCKKLNWSSNIYFKKILTKINNCENIIISDNYRESYYSYKLCANADLIIARHTSLADECLSNEIPVLFHDYSHNMQEIFTGIPNYLPSSLVCNNFEELYQKSKSFLFLNSNKLIDDVKELNRKIYYVNNKKNIKIKIINDLENQLIKNKTLN